MLADDVQGRVDITRTFDGREINTEYLFGLFANLALSAADPNAFSLLGIPTAYEITHFAASENIASASTRYVIFFSCSPYLTSNPFTVEDTNIVPYAASNSSSRLSTPLSRSRSKPGMSSTRPEKSPCMTPLSQAGGNGLSTRCCKPPRKNSQLFKARMSPYLRLYLMSRTNLLRASAALPKSTALDLNCTSMTMQRSATTFLQSRHVSAKLTSLVSLFGILPRQIRADKTR